MHSVMRGLSGMVICAASWWLSVSADGMSYPLPARLIQSAYRSLVFAGSYHVRVRLVTDLFGQPFVSHDNIDIGLRPMRERDDGSSPRTVQIRGQLLHFRSRGVRLSARGVEVDEKPNGEVVSCVLSAGLNILPTWVYTVFIQYPRTIHRLYAVTLGPASIHGIAVWHVRQGLREIRPNGPRSVHPVYYDVDFYVSRGTGRLVREFWRERGHGLRMAALADYSAYGKRVVVTVPPRAKLPGECRGHTAG